MLLKRPKRRKKTKRNKKISFNIKKVFLLFFSFVFIVYLIYSFFILFSIRVKDPLSENISSHKFLSTSQTDLEKTVYIIERDLGEKRSISDVYVFLHNSRKENAIVIYMPGAVYFKGLEGDFGSPLPISSLRYAGDFLQKERGVEYALWQLNEILGFRVDNYIWITTEAHGVINSVYGDTNNVKEKYKEGYILDQGGSLTNSFLKLHTMSSQYSFLKSVFKVSKLRDMDNQVYSNLSFLTVLNKIGSFGRVVNNSKTYVMDLSSPRYSTEELSEHGGPTRSINISEYDKALRRYFINIIDREIERERVRVEVYNGSGFTGQAGMYARKILNNGCDVVRFGNTPDILEKTKIYVSDEKEFSNSLNVVQDVLFGRYEILQERPSFMTTGDIVILLGEDILQLEIF
jgi:hypothetical protein